MKLIILVLVTIVSLEARSQSNSEVYLFDLEKGTEGNYQITSPTNVSKNQGYDNQPSFWPDGKSILYARSVGGQTEIARYFIGSGKTKIITNTLQGSEYSPLPTPDGRISSIRLDTTGLQLLYIYDVDGNAEVLVENLVIGYHAWVEEEGIAAFVLGKPNTLQYISVKSKKSRRLASNIGRSLHKIPGSKHFSFVDKSMDEWIIKSLNPNNGKTKDITIVKDGSEDYCWTPSKDILMGQGSILWSWNDNIGWKSVSDLTVYGLSNITRVTVSPNGRLLAVVVNE